MAHYTLERLEKLLEKNFGDIGAQMYQTSLSKLNVRENSSSDAKKVTSDLADGIKKLYGAKKSKEFMDELNKELAEDEKKLKSLLKPVVDEYFTNKGIPAESDIEEQTRSLVSRGFKADESKLNEMLKELSRDKLVAALNDSVVSCEIRTFLDRYQSYSPSDLDDFINYMKRIAKLQVNDVSVREMIEMQRLFRKFNNLGVEDPWQVKVCRQFVALFNSSKRSDYKYLSLDDSQLRLLNKIAS